jgi:hypothetical protein
VFASVQQRSKASPKYRQIYAFKRASSHIDFVHLPQIASAYRYRQKEVRDEDAGIRKQEQRCRLAGRRSIVQVFESQETRKIDACYENLVPEEPPFFLLPQR